LKEKVLFSIIIPVRTITPYVRETVAHLKRQTEKNFEIIIVTDKPEKLTGARIIASLEPTPAYKRNLGAKASKGQILAFLDDDAYPDSRWLENAAKIFNEEPVAAVCGPALTPPTDSLRQKASGWVWASPLGSGGAGVCRNRRLPRREVDDFSSVNFLVRKSDFLAIGGFNVNHWPGEDTKLCLDLVKMGKKIIYDPKVLVYHHRRAVFLPHLKQISRYALRRGYFARVFPETSFRIGYFLPSFFTFGLLGGLVMICLIPWLKIIYFSSLAVYSLLLLATGFEVWQKERNWRLACLVMIAIVATHLTYGFLFPWGFIQKKLKTVPRPVDQKKKVYLGG